VGSLPPLGGLSWIGSKIRGVCVRRSGEIDHLGLRRGVSRRTAFHDMSAPHAHALNSRTQNPGCWPKGASPPTPECPDCFARPASAQWEDEMKSPRIAPIVICRLQSHVRPSSSSSLPERTVIERRALPLPTRKSGQEPDRPRISESFQTQAAPPRSSTPETGPARMIQTPGAQESQASWPVNSANPSSDRHERSARRRPST